MVNPQVTMNAPLGLGSRVELLTQAHDFFNPKNVTDSHAVIGKEMGKEGLTLNDFCKYLEIKKVFPQKPNVFRIRKIIEKMVSCDLLVHVRTAGNSVGGLREVYITGSWGNESKRGPFRFACALGPEYIYNLCRHGLVHIGGIGKNGKPAAGTGLVISESHILTCRHVVQDMEVAQKQTFQGKEYAAMSIHPHDKVDVAVIRVEEPPLSPVEGIVLQPPVVAQAVYTLGYPKLPCIQDASIIMQSGAVTNASVTSMFKEALFLYSAIARPGNSGGPIMSGDGYLVGIVTEDLVARDSKKDKKQWSAFSPHHAGIPAQIVAKAVADLDLGIALPFEGYG